MRQGDEASDIRTERLANQAIAPNTLASQSGSAQADRVEITQVISSAGVSSLAGTANQIAASALTGPVTLSLTSTVNITTAIQIGGTKVIGAQGAAVADAASANATDLPTAITLVNELKTQLNLLLARVRASTGHGLIA